MYDPMLKHMPRNIQEIHNPKLKRERLAQEKLERVMLNIQRRYGNEYGRVIIRGAKEKDLETLVNYSPLKWGACKFAKCLIYKP